MADYLSDNRTINKDEIKEFIRKYAVDFNLSEIVQNADYLFYRNHLKRLAEELNNYQNSSRKIWKRYCNCPNKISRKHGE